MQQLMRRLPGGMNDLYKQKLQRLEEDDREMLLTALRWLMCSEGRVEIALVADDIEHCYEDLGYDQDDLDHDENGDSNSSLRPFGVSASTDFQDKNIDDEERESIKRLKVVGRDFLKFSSDIIEVQHQSVRDFINSEEESLPRDSRICPECVKRMLQDSIYQAAPKHGHLAMVESIFQKLMSPSFQEKFILIKNSEENTKDKVVAAPAAQHRQKQRSDPSLSDHLTSGSVTTSPQFGFGGGTEAPNDTVSFGMQMTESNIRIGVENINCTPNLPNNDCDKPPRYELARWPRHLRAAEEAWPVAERDSDMQERWEKFYTTIESFLSPQSGVFRSWSKRLAMWHRKPQDPLHVAAKFGLLEVMQRRISYGTNVDMSDEDGWTPLHLACSETGGELGIELLVRHDADVNALTIGKESPLFLLASRSGSSKLFQYLLDNGARPEVPNKDGQTCLHRAAGNRNFELCRILLGCNTINIDAQDMDGDTPLHGMFAFPNTLPELVQMFLDRGVKVNEQNKESEGPLHKACRVGNVPGTRLLLDYHADIDDDNNFGRTALHIAIMRKNFELVKLLVEKGADVYRKDNKGWDCFMRAADKGAVNILEFMLGLLKSQDSLDWALMSRDPFGDTPLHRSALRGKGKAVSILLKAGNAVAMCSQHNDDGITPLAMAAYSGSLQLVEMLLANGADASARSNNGVIPLYSALAGWKRDYNSRKGDFAQTCQKLASASSNDAQNVDVLGLAIETGAIELTETLVNSANTVDAHGWTPIMLAKQYERQDIVRLLSQYDCENNIRGRGAIGDVAVMRPPSRWSTVAKHSRLILSEDGLEVACPDGKILLSFNCSLQLTPTDSKNSSLRLMIAQTDHPIVAGLSEYYYEICVLEAAVNLPYVCSVSFF